MFVKGFNLQNDGGSTCEKNFLMFSHVFEFLRFLRKKFKKKTV